MSAKSDGCKGSAVWTNKEY